MKEHVKDSLIANMTTESQKEIIIHFQLLDSVKCYLLIGLGALVVVLVFIFFKAIWLRKVEKKEKVKLQKTLDKHEINLHIQKTLHSIIEYMINKKDNITHEKIANLRESIGPIA